MMSIEWIFKFSPACDDARIRVWMVPGGGRGGTIKDPRYFLIGKLATYYTGTRGIRVYSVLTQLGDEGDTCSSCGEPYLTTLWHMACGMWQPIHQLDRELNDVFSLATPFPPLRSPGEAQLPVFPSPGLLSPGFCWVWLSALSLGPGGESHLCQDGPSTSTCECITTCQLPVYKVTMATVRPLWEHTCTQLSTPTIHKCTRS